MENKLFKIFNKDKNIIIGALHFPPLLGYKDFLGEEVALKNALQDLEAFEKGGVDAIIIENNYDIPHTEKVSQQTIDIMIRLGKALAEKTKLPIGVNVLWNDFKAGFIIAKAIGGKFIRIPVFVDEVETTDCGVIKGDPKEVAEARKELNAEDIIILTDIHVKHSKLLSKLTIEESAAEAIKNNSDALIITGGWTGQAPDETKLKKVRDAVKDFPILIGSGADENNIKDLFKYVNGAIVSTSLKEGDIKEDEINVKSQDQRIDVKKVKNLVLKVKE